MASRAPQFFSRYIGIGQLVANRESEPLSLAFCKRKARELGRQELLSELDAMPADFYRSIPTLFRQREIASELGGEFMEPVDQQTLERWMLRSPEEYRSEWGRLYAGCESTCKELWPELIERSLHEEIQELALPVTLLQGRHDYCTPSEPVVSWLSRLSCRGPKELIWFDRSAHWPQIEENEKFVSVLTTSNASA
jgi:pimeloyl-ACP methyl ester carboxylesterase